jgi:hypothetical protein
MPAACDDVLERSTKSPLTIDVQVVDVLAETGITDKVGPVGSNRDRDGLMERSVTLVFTGDVMFGRGIDQILPHPGDPRLYPRGPRGNEDGRASVTGSRTEAETTPCLSLAFARITALLKSTVRSKECGLRKVQSRGADFLIRLRPRPAFQHASRQLRSY